MRGQPVLISTAGDVWSLGICLVQLLESGLLAPYRPGVKFSDLALQAGPQHLHQATGSTRTAAPAVLPPLQMSTGYNDTWLVTDRAKKAVHDYPGLGQLIRGCLASKPEDRPRALAVGEVSRRHPALHTPHLPAAYGNWPACCPPCPGTGSAGAGNGSLAYSRKAVQRPTYSSGADTGVLCCQYSMLLLMAYSDCQCTVHNRFQHA
jgi:serine/threonine protein kinase